jgi:hypothetical protein
LLFYIQVLRNGVLPPYMVGSVSHPLLLTWVTCGDVSIRPSRPNAETVCARPQLAVPISSPSGSSIFAVGCSGEFCIAS